MMGRCSAGTFQAGPLLPTPVCIGLGCAIADPTYVTYCDGTAGAGSANPGAAPLGLCINVGASNVCLPLCTFDGASGRSPVGCQGKDTCVATAFSTVASDGGGAAAAYGVGYCFGGCTEDTDCPAGSSCQVEDGVCVTTKTVYSLSIGALCTEVQAGTAAGCNCEYDATTGVGYCTLACVQGGAGCPSGYVCDSLLPGPAQGAGDGGTSSGFSTPPAGLAGVCLAMCAAADGGPDAGPDAGACPSGSTCRPSDLAGNDCLP
jgi:hypothetical protein